MTTITSIDAQFTQAQIRKSSTGISESAANLSSGEKLNANVADLSVGTVLRTRVATLRTTVVNAGQAKSLLSTAKGALETVGGLLQQQKALAVKAADDSLTSNERGFLNQEFQAITAEIDRIATNTNFNGKNLIDGSISGQAALDTVSGEATENYTLTSTADLRLGGVVASGDLDSDFDATTGFDAVGFTASGSVGATRHVATLNFTKGATGETGIQFSIDTGAAFTFDTTVSDATATATDFVNQARAAQAAGTGDAKLRDLVFIDNGNGTVTVQGAELGDTVNAYSLTIGAAAANLTVTINDDATDIAGGTAALGDGTELSTGANRANTANATLNETLLGGLSNVSGTVTESSDGVFSAVFTADVNGTTYTSQAVNLFGVKEGGVGSFVIKSAQAITFSDPNGPVDSNGVLTDNTFSLVVGSNDVSVAGTTLATLQSSVNTIASGLETQLSGAVLTQDRNPNLDVVSATDPDIASALGTFLDGIEGYAVTGNTKGDVTYRTDGFGTDSTGALGSVGSFSFDRDTGILTTSIDGVTYTADLTNTLVADPASDTRTTTGVGGLFDADGGGLTLYDTSTGIFTTTNAEIVLTTADTTDSRELRINLDENVENNVTQVNVTTDEAAAEFANAFNTLFGVSENDSLSFQVGNAATDAIGVSVSSAKTNALYLNDDGVAQSLDITTLSNAQDASNVLDNAINTNIALIAEVEATITRFDSAIENNLTSIQNADAARSSLLDTDFSQESTSFAENTVRQDAAVSVLAQLNARIQNLLQLLR